MLHEGGFDPEERCRLIEALGATVLCQAPTEYRLMAKLDGLSGHDLSRVRHMVSAGEPLNPEVIRVFEEAFGRTIHDGYGQTENTLLVGNYPGAEIRPGSMGLPAPGYDVRVIDFDGREAAPGEEGDIALRGDAPALFAGYWNAPEETAAVYRGEWYVTGDRAVRDEDGYLWFTGRADDVILSAAYRIGPFEVESALLEHPAVAESAVVGKPDPDRGQIVKAFVVLRPGQDADAALVVGAPGALQARDRAVQVPTRDRVRRRASEDAEREDQAGRTASAGGRASTVVRRDRVQPVPSSRGARRGSPVFEHGLRLVERHHDRPGRLDAADHEQVEPFDLALAVRVARGAQVVGHADDPPLLRVALHQRVEDPDLAGGAVVDHRAVQDREHGIRLGQRGPVLREDPIRGDGVVEGELVLVRDEDVEARSRAAASAHSSMNRRSAGVNSGPAK